MIDTQPAGSPCQRPRRAGTAAPLTDEQRSALHQVRESVPLLDKADLPGRGTTLARWRHLAAVARGDLPVARLTEGHLDARAILADLVSEAAPDVLSEGGLWGVWAAEPARLQADRVATGWRLRGEKRWCSGATGIDRALVTAVADDGPRLFVVDPRELDAVAGSWPALGMAATASFTMRFDVTVDAADAIGGPDAYVDRAGFWHGGAGVAACWFGGAVGVADRIRSAAAVDDALAAPYGRVHARLATVAALLRHSAAEIDADPGDLDGARRCALRCRLAVEDVARRTLDETTGALGAGPLAFEPAFAKRVVDLELYLRQLKPGPSATELGLLAVEQPIGL